MQKACFVIWMCLFASAVAGAEELWPYPDLNHRRLVVVEPTKAAPQTAQVRFNTAGAADLEGKDVRVFAAGKTIPHRILQMGPGSLCRIAFPVDPKTTNYYVFYGKKGAPAPDVWTPQAGLMLRTLRYNGGPFENSGQLHRVIREAGPLYGANLTEQVFHGENPFGPSDNYVSVYEGKIYIPQDGAYRFATSCDDASEMRIDGKIVAKRYGGGGAVRDVRFMGEPVKLTRGKHLFEYFHIEGEGQQAAVAAWKPPGGEWEVIPPSAFGAVVRGTLAEYKVRGQAVSPDVSAENSGEVIFQDQWMIRYSFKNATTDAEVFQFKPHWDFGDGTTAETINPEHVYFRFGDYTVTLTLSRGNKSYSTQQQIIVDEGWERQTVPNDDNLHQYYRIIRDYQLQTMKIEDVDRAMDVFAELDAHDEMLRASMAVVDRRQEAAPAVYLRHALILAEELCKERKIRNADTEHKPNDGSIDPYAGVDFHAKAVAVLRQAENDLKEPEQKLKAALKLGDIFFYYISDYEQARAEYERILKTYADTMTPELRTAQIRLGDYYRKLGETEKARQAYQAASKILQIDQSYARQKVRLGFLQESTENYLQRGEYDAAREQLNILEWEFPEEKLSGRTSMLRAELAEKQEDLDEAIVQLEDFLAGNRQAALAPEALLKIAELRKKQEDYAAAVEACDRLIADYLDSPLRENAILLAGECLLNSGKPQQALERFQQAQESYPGSEHQTRTMLLMGDCWKNLEQPDRARQTWQEIIKKFPKSDEKKLAEQRLNN